MEKYIEIHQLDGKHKDRYHIEGITVDEFIDTMVKSKDGGINQLFDITKEEFESHINRKYSIELNVENRFSVTHYVSEHVNKRSERKWLQVVNEIKQGRI